MYLLLLLPQPTAPVQALVKPERQGYLADGCRLQATSRSHARCGFLLPSLAKPILAGCGQEHHIFSRLVVFSPAMVPVYSQVECLPQPAQPETLAVNSLPGQGRLPPVCAALPGLHSSRT